MKRIINSSKILSDSVIAKSKNMRYSEYSDEDKIILQNNAKKLANYLVDTFSAEPDVLASVDYDLSNNGKIFVFNVYFNGDKEATQYEFLSVPVNDLFDYDNLINKIVNWRAYKYYEVVRDTLLDMLQIGEVLHSAPIADIFRRMYNIPGSVEYHEYLEYPKYKFIDSGWSMYSRGKCVPYVNIIFYIYNYRVSTDNIKLDLPLEMTFKWGGKKGLESFDSIVGLDADEIIADCASQFNPTFVIDNLNEGLDRLETILPEGIVVEVSGNLNNRILFKVYTEESEQSIWFECKDFENSFDFLLDVFE